jgi:hypothetical protein
MLPVRAGYSGRATDTFDNLLSTLCPEPHHCLAVPVELLQRLGDEGTPGSMGLDWRWTRTGPTSLEYVATIEDPTVWTRPWTVKQEFTRQSEEANRPLAG